MIRSMNLDGMFIPFPTTEIKFEKFIFPGGEIHIKLNPRVNYENIEMVIITHRVNTSNDLMEIILAKDALKRVGVKHFQLVIPYLPYARQDRKCNYGEPHSLKVFSEIINTLNFEKVYVLDAHSDVAEATVDNIVNIGCEFYVDPVVDAINNPDLIYVVPDIGARKKASKIFSYVGSQRDTYKGKVTGIPFSRMIQGDKIRNMKTGALKGFHMACGDLNGTDCLIVDDICDGGGTFLGLAEELRNKGVGKLYLFVTHGIFSKGYSTLLKSFTKIYTTNSVQDIDILNVEQIKINIDEQFINK